jgi:hypothetical protein
LAVGTGEGVADGDAEGETAATSAASTIAIMMYRVRGARSKSL